MVWMLLGFYRVSVVAAKRAAERRRSVHFGGKMSRRFHVEWRPTGRDGSSGPVNPPSEEADPHWKSAFVIESKSIIIKVFGANPQGNPLSSSRPSRSNEAQGGMNPCDRCRPYHSEHPGHPEHRERLGRPFAFRMAPSACRECREWRLTTRQTAIRHRQSGSNDPLASFIRND